METEFDLDAIVTIVCPQHGDFTIKAGDHIGENVERIAYGCPKCDDNKVLQPKSIDYFVISVSAYITIKRGVTGVYFVPGNRRRCLAACKSVTR